MCRYYFDLVDIETSTDTLGTELADDEAARIEAVLFAGQYVKDRPAGVGEGREVRVLVLSADRTPMFLVVVLGIGLARPHLKLAKSRPS